MDKLNLLALMVALSAYLAAVRMTVIGRLGSTPAPNNPQDLKTFLVLLIPADAPLVVGGLFLTADLFWIGVFGAQPPSWLFWWAQVLFIAAISVLAIHHIVSWGITISKAVKG